ncbi:hypothetical protein TWF192_004968 [Orbilia oligospora]|nr:hypothetical protein TWF679_000452 [Orbilia oligospora]KAF3224735.1 hypothetical protein TWF191_005902 [Orbilia oligospora]KAF3251476.1 hypothetical protein TWF192_004968 [Orbilia oligospora]
MRDLYREWTFTFANPLLLYQLMILSYDTRGYVFRLLREYRFTAPPIDGLLVFSEATSTDIESPGRQTRLFDIVHPSTPISDESNSAFRTWALMTHERTTRPPIPGTKASSLTVTEGIHLQMDLPTTSDETKAAESQSPEIQPVPLRDIHLQTVPLDGDSLSAPSLKRLPASLSTVPTEILFEVLRIILAESNCSSMRAKIQTFKALQGVSRRFYTVVTDIIYQEICIDASMSARDTNLTADFEFFILKMNRDYHRDINSYRIDLMSAVSSIARKSHRIRRIALQSLFAFHFCVADTYLSDQLREINLVDPRESSMIYLIPLFRKARSLKRLRLTGSGKNSACEPGACLLPTTSSIENLCLSGMKISGFKMVAGSIQTLRSLTLRECVFDTGDLEGTISKLSIEHLRFEAASGQTHACPLLTKAARGLRYLEIKSDFICSNIFKDQGWPELRLFWCIPTSSRHTIASCPDPVRGDEFSVWHHLLNDWISLPCINVLESRFGEVTDVLPTCIGSDRFRLDYVVEAGNRSDFYSYTW